MSKKIELLENAAQIIYEEGLQKLTMDYLANKSDITKGGVLYHFKSKGNLLLEMNRMAIEKFEEKMNDYEKKLSGKATFTRSYALATLHFLNSPEEALLPAVFITALEDKASHSLWKATSNRWEDSFYSDTGNEKTNLNLKLMCDGIWFSILHGVDKSLHNQMERLIIEYCELAKKGEV